MLFSSSKTTLAICLALASAFFTRSADAAITVSIDWDNTLIGIQNTTTANVGDTVTASIVFLIDGASSISSFEMSTRFSSNDLSFINGSRVDSGFNAFPFLTNLSAAGDPTQNIQDTMFTDPQFPTGTYGENIFIAGNSIGNAPPNVGIGPDAISAPNPFVVSTFQFTVLDGANGLVLIPGNFADGVNKFDVFFDNIGDDVTASVIFQGGSLTVTAVPEPSTLALLSTVVVAGGIRRYRTRKNISA